MRALIAISILALIALLWAGLSIARHVRRARKSRRRGRAEVTPVSSTAFKRTEDGTSVSNPADTPPQLSDYAPSKELSGRSAGASTEPPVKSPPGSPLPAPSPSPRHPLSPLGNKMDRPDWAYFNKDMGDLTDPYEASRGKSKHRAGN